MTRTDGDDKNENVQTAAVSAENKSPDMSWSREWETVSGQVAGMCFLVEQVKLPRICRMQRTNQSSSVICASPDRRPSSFDLPVLRLRPLRPNTTPVRPPLLEPEPWSILIRRPQSSMNDPQKSSIFTDIHECGTSSSTQHRTRLNQVWNR